MTGTRFQRAACRLACGRSIVKTHTGAVPRFCVGLAIALLVVAPSVLCAGEPDGACPAEFPVVMHPENLDCPYHGFIIRGAVEGGGAGYSVASAGDINNDGIDDLIVGTGSTYPTYWWGTDGSPPGIGAGEAYVIFGGPDWDSLATFDLADLDGTNGFKFVGLAPNERFGLVVARAGDVNNDGIDDVLISNAEGEPSGEAYIGHTYVVFGQSDIGSGGAINLAELDGTNGFVAAGLQSGHSVSAAGDINADGVDDILIGAATNRNPSCSDHLGRAYLIFGGAGNWPPIVTLGDLAGSTGVNGTNGFAIQARPEGQHCSYGGYAALTVAGLADINQDGLDDLVVGAPGDSWSTGAGYVILGGAGDWPAVVEAADLAGHTGENGSNGFIVDTVGFSLRLGFAVSSAGDVNNDDIPDLLIGAPVAPNGQWIGRGYVIFGSADLGESGLLNVEDLDGSNGFTIEGFDEGSEEFLMLGSSLSAAGDFNGDGFDDVILGTAGVVIGLPFNGAYLNLRDEAFVVFGGSAVGEDGWITVSDLDGSKGFKFEGSEEPYDRSETSRSVASAGDLNGDGFDDIVIGAPGAGQAGEAYVLWGCPQLGNSDCNDNLIADACETDCNTNGVPDECDVGEGSSEDCNANGIPDECELADGSAEDCNENAVLDECDIADGTSSDLNGNGIPDECDCFADLDADGAVGPFDLAVLLGSWGPCPGCPADLSDNGVVDALDLAWLLGSWGPCE